MELNTLDKYIGRLPLTIDDSYQDVHFSNLKQGKVYLITDDEDEDDMLGIYTGPGETQNRRPTAEFDIVARLKGEGGNMRWVKQDYSEEPEEKYYIREENERDIVKFYSWVNAFNRVGGRRKTRRVARRNRRSTRRAYRTRK